jgi:hypothetical protein
MKPPYCGNGCLEGLFFHNETKSMPGFMFCVSTPFDVRTTTKSPNDVFLRTCPRR